VSEQQDRPTFLEELKRRRVVRVAVAYAAAAFVVLQGAQIVFEALEVPNSFLRVLVVAALAGFPVALLLGWVFDLTTEGLVLSPSAGRGGRLVARFRPAMLFGGAALALAGSLAFAVALGAPRTAQAVVAPGADLIAVLPFSTSGGPEVKVLEQGMVDLLSRNLGEVGTLRTVDPRLVLSRWQERARGRTPSFEDQLAVARETAAGSFLTGSVVQAGPSVRISADLYAIDGRRLASVQADGQSRDLLALVDTVSLALLREVWRGSEPLPRLNVGAITSSDLGAIRAFLEGERHYRASDWDAAVAAFRRAVAEDSLFALAHYRLSASAGWLGNRELATRHSGVAMRLVDRLPAREQTLVRAEALRSAGQEAAAADTLSAHVERYADDPEGWFLLADVLYHLRDERAGPSDVPPQRQLSLFDRVLELDPAYVPALIHPLEVAFRAADTALAARYVDIVSRAPSVDSSAVRVYRAGLQALRAPGERQALARGIAEALASPTGSANLGSQARRAVLVPLLRDAALLPPAERRALAAGVEAEVRRRTPAQAAEGPLAHLLLAGGRAAEGRRGLEAHLARRPSDKGEMRRLAAVAVLAGVADSSLAAGDSALALTALERAAAEALGAVDRADLPALRRAAARLKALPDSPVVHGRDTLVAVAEAFARVLSGDARGGLNAVEDALGQGGFIPGGVLEPFWFRWVERLGMDASTRGRARRILELRWPGDPVYDVLRLHALGRVLEAEGDAAGARAAYARFLQAASEADRASPLQARVAHARAALGRLGQAPR
jgi:TolB-like protein